MSTGSTIVIRYNGTDITSHCLYAEARFEAQMAAVPGTFDLTVKDTAQTLSFTTGKELTLDVDGTRLYGGYVTQVTKKYAFPADNTALGAGTVKSREWGLTGVDYNVLFDKLRLYNSSDPTHQIPDVTGSPTDGSVIRTLFDDYFVLPSGFDFSSATYILNNHTFSTTGRFVWPTQGSTMREVMDGFAQYGSVYWIDANKQLHFIPVQNTASSWGFSDMPNNDPIGVGVPTRGFRDGEYTEDGTSIVNDALVWGGSEWADGGDVVFARRENSTSISAHGRWQTAEVRVGDANYKSSAEVTARAKVIVDGNESGIFAEGSQGLVNPEKQFRCIWFSTGVPSSGGSHVHLVPTQVVPIELWVFSQDSGVTPFHVDLPLRQVTLTFPTLDPTGKAYVQFEGYFGILMSDPYYLWKYLRQGKTTIARSTPIASATNSTSSPRYGAQYFDVPTPTPNGVATVFTIPFPYIGGTTQLYVNGLLQDVGSYTETSPSAGTITLTFVPATGDQLAVAATLL